MAAEGQDGRSDIVEDKIKDMKIEGEGSDGEDAWGTIRVEEEVEEDGDADVKQESHNKSGTSSPRKKGATQSPEKRPSRSQSADMLKGEREEVMRADITVKVEPGQPPRLASRKVAAGAPPMFDHYADKTGEATKVFQAITDCIYAAKYLGSTEHAMECDCTEEWGKPA
jgi:[histone H3]-lysine36 N-trimethyltransferase